MSNLPRILIVEDEPVVSQDLQRRFQYLGYETAGVTSDGESALALAEKLEPDLVLMDIHLAGSIDGIEAARLIRTRYHIPVVFVSGYSEESILQEATTADPYGYVIKPVEDNKLKVAIEVALRLHRSDMALSISEGRYRELVEHINDVIFTVNTAGLITYVSPVVQAVLGYLPQELIGHHFVNLFLSDEHADVTSAFQDFLQDRNTHREFRILHKSGEVRWSRISCRPVTERGQPEGIRGILSDITAQKRTESAIRAIEGKYRKMVETANEGIWVTDERGKTTFANSQMADMLGCTVDDMLDKTWSDFLFPEDQVNSWCRAIHQMEKTDEPVEGRFLRKDGTELWVLASSNVLHHEDGRTIGSFAMLTNITERKKAELKLRDSERKFSAVFQLGPIAIMLNSLQDELFLDVNESFRRETGYSRVEVINRSFDDLGFFANAGEHDRMQSDIREHGCCYGREVSFRSKSGALLSCLFSAGVVTIGDQLVILSSFLNITDNKRTEVELQGYREFLYHQDRVVKTGEIATALAHELNQPLTGILINAQAAQFLLEKKDPDLAELRDVLADIVADDKRAGAVIRGLRDFLKKDHILHVPCDLNDTVKDFLAILKSDALLRDAPIKTQFAPNLPHPCMNRIQIQQVLLNLVLNAEQAMENEPKDKRGITITTARHPRGGVQVSIQDDGPGLKADQFDRFFEPFFTTKVNGLGMGLPICRSILDAHGGRIWAENNPGRGARICFMLPVKDKTDVGENRT